jgi:hypothetical protein
MSGRTTSHCDDSSSATLRFNLKVAADELGRSHLGELITRFDAAGLESIRTFLVLSLRNRIEVLSEALARIER